tara:strand:- start:10236 stop:10445 length:210 start_codon:yes stop_codon:yes gene_type:complete
VKRKQIVWKIRDILCFCFVDDKLSCPIEVTTKNYFLDDNNTFKEKQLELYNGENGKGEIWQRGWKVFWW